jgi:hypothetical protein
VSTSGPLSGLCVLAGTDVPSPKATFRMNGRLPSGGSHHLSDPVPSGDAVWIERLVVMGHGPDM